MEKKAQKCPKCGYINLNYLDFLRRECFECEESLVGTPALELIDWEEELITPTTPRRSTEIELK